MGIIPPCQWEISRLFIFCELGKSPPMDTFKKRLEYWMKKRGYKDKPLALKAGLNETAVRDILGDRVKSVRVDTMVALCGALDIRPHQLSPEIESLYTPQQIELLNKIAELEDEIESLS